MKIISLILLLSFSSYSAIADSVSKLSNLEIKKSPHAFIHDFNASMVKFNLEKYSLTKCTYEKSGTYSNALSINCDIQGGGYASFYSDKKKHNTYLSSIMVPVDLSKNSDSENQNIGKILYSLFQNNTLGIGSAEDISKKLYLESQQSSNHTAISTVSGIKIYLISSPNSFPIYNFQ